MSLKNVEKYQPKLQQPKWYQRFNKPLATAVGATSLALAGTSANAFLVAADVTTATTGAGGEEVLKTAGIWLLTISVGVAILLKVVSLTKK